ncbi:hypothetical protein SAMN05518683_104189 [Salibacterium halotolerans]|uniref:Uncharacterized protein n=1 Tax=Salibacterium halotolerans TaxID=1884432 RepID=A0A1I5PR23_9BACI|nr:hypothetical protein SAMN05518683_104189 [Salibacterium halotolerans]
MRKFISHVKRIDSKWKSSPWRLSYYALISFIGGSIGWSLFNFNIYSILGVLTGSLIMVTLNAFYVMFKK